MFLVLSINPKSQTAKELHIGFQIVLIQLLLIA